MIAEYYYLVIKEDREINSDKNGDSLRYDQVYVLIRKQFPYAICTDLLMTLLITRRVSTFITFSVSTEPVWTCFANARIVWRHDSVR